MTQELLCRPSLLCRKETCQIRHKNAVSTEKTTLSPLLVLLSQGGKQHTRPPIPHGQVSMPMKPGQSSWDLIQCSLCCQFTKYSSKLCSIGYLKFHALLYLTSSVIKMFGIKHMKQRIRPPIIDGRQRNPFNCKKLNLANY